MATTIPQLEALIRALSAQVNSLAVQLAQIPGGGGVPANRTITSGAGLTGGGTLAADRTIDVVAHADGSIVVNSDSVQVGVIGDAQHGSRGGGSTHAAAVAAGAAGFLLGSDKTKIDVWGAGAANTVSAAALLLAPGPAAPARTIALAASTVTTTDATTDTPVLTFPVPNNYFGPVFAVVVGEVTAGDKAGNLYGFGLEMIAFHVGATQLLLPVDAPANGVLWSVGTLAEIAGIGTLSMSGGIATVRIKGRAANTILWNGYSELANMPV